MGCIWSGKEEVTAIINAYCKWASGKNEGKAVIVYDTMWGATAKMAEAAMSVSRMPEFRWLSTALQLKTFLKLWLISLMPNMS